MATRQHSNFYLKVTDEPCVVIGADKVRYIVNEFTEALGGRLADEWIRRIDLCLDVPHLVQRTRFFKIIRRAGLKPWPKLFHNLRASRQAELAAEFLIHVVCEWIGNSEAIAKEHYLRKTEADFEKACSALQNAVQYTAAGHCRWTLH